ncbi:hypothetical protein ACS5NO_09205 [Larkinella sp. GY13]|uniref:hypothetical protein n=1 Tax=Larkinella sp. GY13 TaxID=3453720 RepID=UPI003EE95167
MDIKEYIGEWVSCKTLYYKDVNIQISRLDLVHSLDVEFVRTNRTATIFKCVGITKDDFIILKAKKITIRVKIDAIDRVFPRSKFDFKDRVFEKERPSIVGEIDDIIWHQKDGEFKYFISINGKLKSKRYGPNELGRLET